MWHPSGIRQRQANPAMLALDVVTCSARSDIMTILGTTSGSGPSHDHNHYNRSFP